MKTFRIVHHQRLATDLQTAWGFFSDPANLRLITPPWLDFTITSPLPESIYAGLVITYRIRPVAGIAVAWVSEITHVAAPHFFVDEQRHGPYRFWHHQHRLAAVDGGVENTDEVHYRLPGGLIGIGLHALMIRRRLDAIFRFRRRALHRIFAGPDSAMPAITRPVPLS
ncbi:SRPBCC domain-containing protein [Desulfosarcina alkanivorans]|uniref:SRPBCC domain-containing protein n=1 Tax=Desulfosarcina alkanivorans TaxID=571177 RepID=A0A5K7YMC3_9BACT|nr:SRPBCC family protein [Desulfosarcina alkanivorans]BBO69009.1 SRPBCC domain-containing protein [Desulfosarcina alkanivorans]